MPKTTTSLETPLRDHLDRLSAFEPADAPVLSLYVDMRPGQEGRPRYESPLRKMFKERSKGLSDRDRGSFDADVDRILQYLAGVRKSVKSIAIFACSRSNSFFDAITLEQPIDQHRLFVGPTPHLYPLARLNDQYPRYAAVILDTNSARIFVFALGSVASQRQVQGVKTRKSSGGGMSQNRYQRHVQNLHEQHMKEVVDVLDRVVREESINQIVVACDEVSKPLLFEHLPRHLAERVIDVVKLDAGAPEHQVLAQTLEALKEKDARSDADRVRALLDAWRAGGLAVVGPDDTLKALTMGEVEELLISSTDPEQIQSADELIAQAQRSAARIRFIEDGSLLKHVGGVGALLRFKAGAPQGGS